MTMTVEATPLDEEVYLGEEGTTTLEGEDEGFPQFQANANGSVVADGSYVVPKGVAVEPLKNYGGHKDLKNKCPDDVRRMLEEKGLFDAYDRFVQAIVDTKNTRGSLLGKWRDEQFVSVLDLFRDDFTAKGVRVALCKRRSGSGAYRWLEFIDVEAVGGSYVPQHDVANRSGQIVKTAYTKLKFPNGVAVEELKQWGGRRKLKEKVPIHVETMLKEHGLMKEYDQMVDHVIEAGAGSKFGSWKIDKLKPIMDEYKPIFRAKGIDIFISHKQEYISHGQYGGHVEHYRWIEFVDRDVQPSYQPQRDADTKDEQCHIM
ncbi:hypothetical protein ACHAXR_008337 [Thalassiosira sp. AJA248-18]